jgi:hypothetical protein
MKIVMRQSYLVFLNCWLFTKQNSEDDRSNSACYGPQVYAGVTVVFCLMSKAGKLKFGYCKDHILILVGVVFWNMGAYAPYILKCILHTFWISKKLEKKVCTYIFTCYALTKSFRKKSTCHLTCLKKTKLRAENNAFRKISFLFFT